MTRGLGQLQKINALMTHYKIITQLYQKPRRSYGYEELLRLTGIDRRILRRRLDELVDNGIIRKTTKHMLKSRMVYSVVIRSKIKTSMLKITKVYFPSVKIENESIHKDYIDLYSMC